MSKELEALRNFISECENDWKTQPKRLVNGAINSNVSKYMDSLKSILTPPTAEEVCKALSECLITKVVYKHKTKTFYLKQSTFNVELVSYYYDEDKKDYVMHFEFAEPLPPHLITLIGRFYEGLEKEKEDAK